jgi:hypothetical protein
VLDISESNERQYWLWVTRPDYYLDEDGCDYEVLYKFEQSLHVKDLRQNPYFDEWGPLRCSFQRSNFKISLEYWNKLNNLLALSQTAHPAASSGACSRRLPSFEI